MNPWALYAAGWSLMCVGCWITDGAGLAVGMAGMGLVLAAIAAALVCMTRRFP